MMESLEQVVLPIPLVIAQALRLVVILTFPAIILLCFEVSRDKRLVRVQRLRFLALAILSTSACYSAIYRFHLDPTPLLLLNVAGMVVSVLGLWSCRAGHRDKWLGHPNPVLEKREG